jgi:hypothetical protein
MDSNHHKVALASPSSWCVYQFRHHRTNDIQLSKSAAKKKYLFTSDSCRCQQKTAIFREPLVREQAEPGLQVQLVRFAGLVLQVPPERLVGQELQEQHFSEPVQLEQTCPT